VNSKEKTDALNKALAEHFQNWQESSAERRCQLLENIKAVFTGVVLEIPEGMILEVLDKNQLFNSYYQGTEQEEIIKDLSRSNPDWWRQGPSLKLRPRHVKDEQRFRIRIRFNDEEEIYIVKSVSEAVTKFEFLLWEENLMPVYKELQLEDEESFRRTGRLVYGSGEDAPTLEIIR